MARSGDLTPYLSRPRGSGDPLTFRQGTVVSWNQTTAENVIRVGDQLFENLACLNTSEASLLVPGDVVGIMVAGATWAVMGRLIIPGSAEAASSIKSITNRIVAAEDPDAGLRNSTGWGDLNAPANVGPSVTLNVGPSGRALCFWSCEIGQVVNVSDGLLTWMTKNTPHVGVAVSGATTRAATDLNALNLNLQYPTSSELGYARSYTWLQASMMHLFTGLNPGMTTFTMKYRHDTLVPSGTNSAFGAREIAVFAL